jgi:recA bacterial DNA recombination protein
MAKKPTKPSIEKKEFDLDAFLESENINSEPKDKELTWVPLSKAWHDALKLPGFPRGYLSLVRGYSNTGKSTAFYEAIAGCQKIGDLAIVIETEGNWNTEHAKNVGVKFKEVVDKETGEIKEKPDGFILIRSRDLYEMYKNYNHQDSKMMSKPTRGEPVIEDVSLFISEMLQKQEDGLIPRNMCFLWDSIGTLNCYKSACSNASNNMWNAGAMNCFQAIVNFKIPSSRSEDSLYTNTMICVQKIWLDNMNGTVIKHKGGEFMFFNSRIIVHIGGILTHGTKKLTAVALGQDFQYGTEAKIRCEKNHVTGIERNGSIASTPHGYINPSELDAYKKERRQFIHDALNVSYDAEISFEEVEGVMEGDDIKE